MSLRAQAKLGQEGVLQLGLWEAMTAIYSVVGLRGLYFFFPQMINTQIQLMHAQGLGYDGSVI